MSVELGVVVGIALAMATVIAIVLPLRASPPNAVEDTSAKADLMARRESAFQVLRDLDSDFEAGKLSEEDYRPMRVQSLAQAAEIMAQLDAAQAPAMRPVESTAKPAPGSRPSPSAGFAESIAESTGASAPGRRRMRQDAAKFCPHCGAARSPDDAFCRKCGKPLG